MSLELAPLSFELAQSAVGEPFSVSLHEDGQEIVQMLLSQANPIGTPHELCALPFSLMFEGPASTPFAQGTYFFTHPKMATHPIFIVPLAQNDDVRQYQAIFN